MSRMARSSSGPRGDLDLPGPSPIRFSQSSIAHPQRQRSRLAGTTSVADRRPMPQTWAPKSRERGGPAVGPAPPGQIGGRFGPSYHKHWTSGQRNGHREGASQAIPQGQGYFKGSRPMRPGFFAPLGTGTVLEGQGSQRKMGPRTPRGLLGGPWTINLGLGIDFGPQDD